MKKDVFRKKRFRWVYLAMALLILLIGLIVLIVRDHSQKQKSERRQSSRLLRISDEGSLTRPSPEESFLEAAIRAKPKVPLSLDEKNLEGETLRIFGNLHALFQKMKTSAERYKKADPLKYAEQMSSFWEELVALFHASKTLLERSNFAIQELFKRIQNENDPTLKKYMSFLLRFVHSKQVTPFVEDLSKSESLSDRITAIKALEQVPSHRSAEVLIQKASSDPNLEIRQRAILSLGKLVSRPSKEYKNFKTLTFDSLRKYTQPENEPSIREAAWNAFASIPNLELEDQKRIQNALREEKNPTVRRSVENAWRKMNIQSQQRSKAFQQKTKSR